MGRSSRNSSLAIAATIGALSSVLLVASRLGFLWDTQVHESFSLGVARMLSLGGAVAMASAFVAARIGFLHSEREQRRRTLVLSGRLFAVSGAAILANAVWVLIASTSSYIPWTITAAQWVRGAEGLALVVAGLLAASGLRSEAPSADLTRACVALGVHFGLAAVAVGLELAGYRVFIHSGRFEDGFGLVALGLAVSAGAAAKAAIAFRAGRPARDRGLADSAVYFAIGFFLSAVGVLLTVRYFPRNEAWLEDLSQLTLAVAAAEGALAFFAPARAAQPS